MSGTALVPFRLKPPDAERYVRLRLEMLREAPWAFGSSPGEDPVLHLDRVARMLAEEDREAILAIEANPAGQLIAAASITRAREPKFAHRARIWGVFVEESHRGRGLGRAVTEAAVALARSWIGVDFVDLSVSEHSPGAWRLYETLGLRGVGS